MRIATFNIENLDFDADPPRRSDARFDTRVRIIRPMLERMRADIICFQEVHGQNPPAGVAGPRQLLALRKLLENTRYAGFTLSATTRKDMVDVYAERNLVVAAHPDYRVEEVRAIENTLVSPPKYSLVTSDRVDPLIAVKWERPTLYVRLRKGDADPLHILNVHFKSKNPTNVSGQGRIDYKWKTASGWAEGFFLSSMKRVGAALEARIFIDSLFDADEDANILICGDFNAEPDEVPVMAIRGRTEETGNPDLNPRVMHPVALSIADSRRFTLYHHGKPNLLDHVVVSRRMMATFREAEIHNEMLHDESVAFASDDKYPESDHAPMVAEFDDAAIARDPTA